MQGRAQKSGRSEADVARELVATIPAGRFGRAEETGAAIAFLCTPAAAYINGVNLPVDGGRLPTL
jgi:3-oxoacyl-[acyl-carrier protein] reductase